MPDHDLEYVYANTDVNWISGNSTVTANNWVPAGTTFTLSGSGTAGVVSDDDSLLEDSVNVNQQTLDRSEQVLASDMGTNAAGDYVFSRGYYEVQDEQGNIGRLYQVRIAPWDHQGAVPQTTTQYWVFSGDIIVDPGMTYTVLGTPDPNGQILINPVGNVNYDDLTRPRCFVAGTRIDTARGPVAVEALKVGDLVRTRDHGFKPVMWIESQRLDADLLALMPHLRQIRIAAGALGGGLPARDISVSPQHRLVVRNPVVRRMFDTDEVLVAAKHLLGAAGIELVEDPRGVDYHHFLLDQHEIVFAEGAETETLYTGPEALKSLTPEARREIFALFPGLASMDHGALPLAAGQFAGGKRARRMVERAARNGVELLAG